MKALAIRQPFAWLIVHGHEEVESRPWLTHYRGPFLVHANKAIDKQEVQLFRAEKAREGIVIPDNLPTGGIVGVVTLVDCVPPGDVSGPREFLGRLLGRPQPDKILYRFILEDPRPLPFVPYRGQQKFFNVPDDLYGSELNF